MKRAFFLSVGILISAFPLDASFARQVEATTVPSVNVSVDPQTWIEFTPLSKAEVKMAVGLDKFSRCVAESKEIDIRDFFIRGNTGTENEFDNMSKGQSRVGFERCLSIPGAWKMEGHIDLFIGRIAQAIYLQDFAVMPEIEPGVLQARQADPVHPLFKIFYEISDCVTLNNPEAADALLRTPVGGMAEVQALEALRPSLAKCLKTGYTVPANSLFMRGSFALALYRRAMKPTS